MSLFIEIIGTYNSGMYFLRDRDVILKIKFEIVKIQVEVVSFELDFFFSKSSRLLSISAQRRLVGSFDINPAVIVKRVYFNLALIS